LEISEENRTKIIEFAEYCQAQGLHVPSIVRHIFGLRKAAKRLGESFKDADKNDITRPVTEIERATKKDSNGRRTDEPLSEETKRNEKVSLKKFYKWLRGCGEEYPDEVRWIKPHVRNHRKLPMRIFSPKVRSRDLPSLRRIFETEP